MTDTLLHDEQTSLMIRVASPDAEQTCAQLDEYVTQKDLDRALRFAHMLMSVTQYEGREGAVFSRALAELLINKGVLSQDELEAMLEQVRKEFEALATPKVMLGKSEDKYQCAQSVLIDCADRVHLCKARCCTFAYYLTEQDLDEGVVRWDYGQPYWNQRGEDSYCVHCKPGTYQCKVHPNRPYVCRIYDCRNDKRVWEDFEKKIPTKEI